MHTIDLRSDTVTHPSPEMREAMASAEVGDDVYGDDPTVNTLEKYCAELLGFEDAMFTCSGTQANFVALMAHCERGDEYIVGQQAHTYRYEGGGAAVLGSIQPQPIEFAPDGTLELSQIEQKIKPDDYHFARTRLVCLENTQNGRVLPMEYFPKVKELCIEHELKLHLDGARLCNAAVKLQVSPGDIAKSFDSVSLCLSKGLGAPVGSVLAGEHSFISRARRWRKVAGGGMRQAGILAAAGLYALEHNVLRLEEDHRNCQMLTEGLADIPQFKVHPAEQRTNMVFVDVPQEDLDGLQKTCEAEHIRISWGPTTRLVTHLDISSEDVNRVVSLIADYYR